MQECQQQCRVPAIDADSAHSGSVTFLGLESGQFEAIGLLVGEPCGLSDILNSPLREGRRWSTSKVPENGYAYLRGMAPRHL